MEYDAASRRLRIGKGYIENVTPKMWAYGRSWSRVLYFQLAGVLPPATAEPCHPRLRALRSLSAGTAARRRAASLAPQFPR
jgi:hypothetical protein